MSAVKQRCSDTGLLPCPFCNSVNLTAIRIKGGSIRMIECNECRASGPVDYVRPDQYEETEVPAKIDERVRSFWNTRIGNATA
jgi:transcription elongation factor Elf1